MSTRNFLAIAAAALTLSAVPIAAQKPEGAKGRGPGHGRGAAFLASHLDLTETQKAQAKTIFDASRAQAQPFAAQMKETRQALAAAVKANRPAAEIEQIAARQGTLMGQVAGIHAKSFASFYQLLTPEQREKADQLHGRFQGMMERRFSHRRGAPAGAAAR